MRLLFVCSRNRLRSPTAEAVFAAYEGIETASAGTAPDAEVLISADLIEWADLIVVMEAVHRKRLQQRFPLQLRSKRVVVASIRDEYRFMDTKLVAVLQQRIRPLLPTTSGYAASIDIE